MILSFRSKDGRLNFDEVDAQEDCVSFIEDLEEQLENGSIDIDTAIELVRDFNATSSEVSIRTRVRNTVEFDINVSKTINLIERKLKLIKSLTRGTHR
jgi:hypothetical protein